MASTKVADATQSSNFLPKPMPALELQRMTRSLSRSLSRAKAIVTFAKAAGSEGVSPIGSPTYDTAGCDTSTGRDTRTKAVHASSEKTSADGDHNARSAPLPVASASLGSLGIFHEIRLARQDPLPRDDAAKVDVCEHQAAGGKRRTRDNRDEGGQQSKKAKLSESHSRGILKSPGQDALSKKHVRWCTSVVGEGVPVPPPRAVVRSARTARVFAKLPPSAGQKSGSEISNPLPNVQSGFIKTHRRSKPMFAPTTLHAPLVEV